MDTAFDGKSIFIHNVPTIYGGNAELIANLCLSAGINCVMPKITDGSYIFKPSTLAFPAWFGKPNVSKQFVDTMHSKGIRVIGWGFNYGSLGDEEGRVAALTCNNLGLDGWIFDVESIFEQQSNPVGAAGKVLGTFFKNINPRVPTALCSWAYFLNPVTGSRWHNLELAKFWMGFMDYGMPMMYWNKSVSGKPVLTSPDNVLYMYEHSKAQWTMLTGKPIIPVGRAYQGDAGFIQADCISAFANAIYPNGGISWWYLDSIHKSIPGWEALVSTPDYTDIPEPPEIPEPPVEAPSNLYVCSPALNYPRPGGGPLTLPMTRVLGYVGDNMNLIPWSSWRAYFYAIGNTARSLGKILAPDVGPSKGLDGDMLKYIGLLWPGRNVYRVLEIVSDARGVQWGVIESLPRDRIPNPIVTNRFDTPHLISTMYGSSEAHAYSVLTYQSYLPILSPSSVGKWYVEMKHLVSLDKMLPKDVKITAYPYLNVREKMTVLSSAVRRANPGTYETVTALDIGEGGIWGKVMDGWIALRYNDASYTNWII